MSHVRAVLMLGFVASLAACSDRAPSLATAPEAPGTGPATVAPRGAAPRPERLARLFARALKNPAFRAYVKAQLDSSPYPEHKIQLQGFLSARGRRALRDIARENATTEADLDREVAATIPLEVYLPVPAHRAAWNGDDRVLVATAIEDREAPVAFSPDGHRTLLRAEGPPETPVLAVVPVETNFASGAARVECLVECGDGGGGGGSGGGGTTNPAGLYLTRTQFDDDYESWLKGSPEFEIHILGQQGTTDSLKSYQCAGADAGGPYVFDQNNLTWSGSVLLFSQTQINSYKAGHPGQSMRVFALEDDDTPCGIRVNKDYFNLLIQGVDAANRMRTGGRDTTASSGKFWKNALVLRNIIATLASIIRTNDDMIGNGVEDTIVGSFVTGFNWFVKGENNVTHGYLKLEMR